MSQNYRFIVWTDASSTTNYGIEETTTGFVIKDSCLPPLIDSAIYLGIGNSKGELKAGIESLKTLIEYCSCFGIDTKKTIVELKTDFPELKRAIDCETVKSNNLEKFKLLRELKELESEFKDIRCDEINRNTNIAHNVCHFRSRYRDNGTVKRFHEIYENPRLCVRKGSSQD